MWFLFFRSEPFPGIRDDIINVFCADLYYDTTKCGSVYIKKPGTV